jgi:acetyl esterase/lipase
MLKHWLSGLVAICLIAPGAFAADSYTQEQNVVYRVIHGTGLVMDIFRPTGEANGLAVVDTLSGAWYSEQGQYNDHMAAQVFETMCKHGYTVFMVRPGSRTKWTAPEMIDNMHYAIRYIKENAEEYGIDPDKLGLMGASAGGHLSLMTALTAPGGDPEAKDPVLRHDASVGAVSVFFPVTDFLDWDGKPANFDRLGDLLFSGGVGDRDEEEVTKAAEAISPTRLQIVNSPPILIIHGDADDVVPLQQSEKMVGVLELAAVTHKLIIEPGGGHGWVTIPKDVETMAQWFNEHLAGKAAEAEEALATE